MPAPPRPPRRVLRAATPLLLAVGTIGAAAPIGVSAAADGPPAASQATPRALKAGRCSRGTYSSARNLLARVQLLARTPARGVPDGVASEPAISRDSRANRYVAYTSTTTSTAGIVTPGRRNVYVVQRAGKIRARANQWKIGATRLISDGLGGAPADGDSFAPAISGYTGRNDRPMGPRKAAFLSTATNIWAGGNPTGTSAFVTGVRGGPTHRVSAPGTAASVAISGDSKVVYVATDRGLYAEDEGKLHTVTGGGGITNVTTTLNGRQAAFERAGVVYVANLKGGVKRIGVGHDPVADGGVPNGGPRLGYVRAVAYQSGTNAVRAQLDGKRVGLKRMGTSTGSSLAINVGGNGVAFGNGSYACLEVSLTYDDYRRGGYDIPQGACPQGQGTVADLALSSRYNYLVYSCTGGALYLHYVGGK